MDVKKLDVFLKVVKIGSLKKASDELNYTQSGLLYMMNSLEEEMKVPLLQRSPKGVVLSSEGEQLLPYIKNVVEHGNILSEEIEKIEENNAHKIKIATYPIYARYYLTDVVKAFLKDYPNDSIFINVGMESDIHNWLENGDVDLAVGEMEIEKNHKWTHLMEDEIYAAVPASFDVKLIDGRFDMENLKKYKVLSSGFNSSAFKKKIQKYIDDGDAGSQVEMTSLDGSALLAMVENEIGIAFLSGLYRFECPLSVKMYPLDPPEYRKLGIVMRESGYISKTMRKFIPYLEKIQNQMM